MPTAGSVGSRINRARPQTSFPVKYTEERISVIKRLHTVEEVRQWAQSRATCTAGYSALSYELDLNVSFSGQAIRTPLRNNFELNDFDFRQRLASYKPPRHWLVY